MTFRVSSLGQLGGGATNHVPGGGGGPDHHEHGVQLDLGAGAVNVMSSQTVAHIECVEELEAGGLHSLQHLQKIKFSLSFGNRVGGACQLSYCDTSACSPMA